MPRADSPSSSPPSYARKVPPGFLPSKRPYPKPLQLLDERELQELHAKNDALLRSNAPSTSERIAQIAAEQASVEARLTLIQQQRYVQQHPLSPTAESPDSNFPARLSVKQRIIQSSFGRLDSPTRRHAIEPMGYNEAVALQSATFEAQRKEREQAERQRSASLPVPGETLTATEREARILAFMNFKPAESDEDEDDDEDDDESYLEADLEDSATWAGDGDYYDTQGQAMFEPDDIERVIKVDRRRLGNYAF